MRANLDAVRPCEAANDWPGHNLAHPGRRLARVDVDRHIKRFGCLENRPEAPLIKIMIKGMAVDYTAL